MSLNGSQILTNEDKKVRFPSCERWNALVFRPHVVFIIITSGWPGNDETVTLKISPHLNFSCIFIFPFKTVFTKIPKGSIFPPIFPVILIHLGTYIQRIREGYLLTVRTSYIQCVPCYKDLGPCYKYWLALCVLILHLTYSFHPWYSYLSQVLLSIMLE